MKRIILTAMAMAFSLSTLAAQPQSTIQLQGKTHSTEMTSIEDKNRNIMSSFEAYNQRRQQNKLLEQALAEQQYGHFVGDIRELRDSMGL